MKKAKRLFIGFVLLLFIIVEFFIGFIVSVADHISDATTALQKLYNEADPEVER